MAERLVALGLEPSEGPVKWPELVDGADTVFAFSVGTTSCNIGNQNLSWVGSTSAHPVIGQNLYRLKDGRLEQIGMSWLKHGFGALQGSLCMPCQGTGSWSALGVGCSDPYGSSLNGSQGPLGPRSEVNAASSRASSGESFTPASKHHSNVI